MHCISVFLPEALPHSSDADRICERARQAGRYPELDRDTGIDGFFALHFFTDQPELAWEKLREALFTSDALGLWLHSNAVAQLHHEDGDEAAVSLHGAL